MTGTVPTRARGALITALLVTAASLFGCASPASRDCSTGAELCSEREVCDATSRLCVVNRPPKIALATPEEGAVVTGERFELSGLVNDDEAQLPVAELSIDDGATWSALTLGERGRFTVTLAAGEGDGRALSVKVRATDALRQVTELSLGLVVDNTPPRCAIRAPSTALVGGGMTGSSGTAPGIAVRFEATDGAGPVRARVSTDDGESWLDAEVAEGEAQLEWQPGPDRHDLTALRVEVTDANGHVCAERHELTVDTRPPVLVLRSPTAPQPLLAGGPTQPGLEVAIEVSDDSGIESATLDFDDGAGPRAFTGDGAERQLAFLLPMSDHVLHEGVIRAIDAAGNSATLPFHVVVDRVPPRIEALQPQPGAIFNAIALSGMTAVTATWTVTDGDPSVSRRYRPQPSSAWTPLAADALSIQTGPQDNGASYALFLEARDSLGNVGTAQTQFTVDVVPPAVTFNHPNGARLVSHELTATFSEPVTPLGAPATVMQVSGTPPMPGQYIGAWSGNVLGLSGLLGDTVVSATVPQGVVVDAAGNPNAQASSVQFHTAPLIPPSGTLLPTGVTRIDAWSDEEGVLAVFADGEWNGNPAAYRAYWVNPRSGLFEHLGHLEDRGTQAIHSVYVAASRRVVGLASERVFGVSMLRTDPVSGANPSPVPYAITTWRDPAGQVTKVTPPQGSLTTWPQLLVPTARGSGEPANAGRVGWLDRGTSGLYTRLNMPTEPVNLQPRWVRALDENQWAVFGSDGQNLPVNERYCKLQNGQPLCEFHGATVLASNLHVTPDLSAAVVPTRILAVVNVVGARLETCYGPLNTTPCTGFPCAVGAVSSQPALAGDLYIASKNQGNRVIGARKNGTGADIELLEKDLAGGCFPAWQSLGVVPNSANATRWRPVRVGGRSGVIYAEGGALKLWLQ